MSWNNCLSGYACRQSLLPFGVREQAELIQAPWPWPWRLMTLRAEDHLFIHKTRHSVDVASGQTVSVQLTLLADTPANHYASSVKL